MLGERSVSGHQRQLEPRRRLRRLVLAVLACACEAAREESTVLARYVARHPCSAHVSLLVRGSGDQLTARERCALAVAAYRSLRVRPVRSGTLSPSDTNQVVGIEVFPLAVVDPSSRDTTSAYWSVYLHLQDRPYDAEVTVDQGTGELHVRQTHKAIR